MTVTTQPLTMRERVIDAAQTVSDLLARARGLKVLVTSRTPLHIYGEREYALPPLSVPDPALLPSIERLRSNCRTIDVLPSDDVDVIAVTPAMVANCRSRIEATDAAIVSGLAPGSWAVTWMVGNSTRGIAATGSCL